MNTGLLRDSQSVDFKRIEEQMPITTKLTLDTLKKAGFQGMYGTDKGDLPFVVRQESVVVGFMLKKPHYLLDGITVKHDSKGKPMSTSAFIPYSDFRSARGASEYCNTLAISSIEQRKLYERIAKALKYKALQSGLEQ